MKYARIVKLFADRMEMSYEDALDVFYDSDLYKMMSEGIADMHCLSDEYLADELILEWTGNLCPSSKSANRTT